MATALADAGRSSDRLKHLKAVNAGDRDRNRFAASLADLRDRDSKLAVDERGARLGHVARAPEADHAREPAVAALDQMEARFTPRAARRLFAGDEHAVALADDADRGGIDAGQVHGDLEGIVCFVDVERRRALAGERFGPERAPQLEEDLPDLRGELVDLGRQGDGVNSRTHASIVA